MQEHRKLSKQICGRRRHLKREAGQKTLNQGEQDDRAPPGEMGQNVGNERNHSRATTAIDKWLDFEEKITGIETSGLDTTTFVKARKRLKALENIPDGLTVEVLRSLPLELRAQLSTDMRRRLHELDMPGEWFECTADLAPTTAGANTQSQNTVQWQAGRLHISGLTSDLEAQITTDRLHQWLPRQHGSTLVPANWRIVRRNTFK